MHGFGAKCGCRVPHQGHVIAEFCAAAGGGLDAGIGQHPYHDDLFDAALLELESATGIDGVPTRKLRFAGDSPLEGGVSCELVSENAKFPASRENTGNFIDSGLGDASGAAKKGMKSVSYGPIPYVS